MNSKGSLKVRQSKEAFVFALNCLGKKNFEKLFCLIFVFLFLI